MSAMNDPAALTVDFSGGYHPKLSFSKLATGLLKIAVAKATASPVAWAKAGLGVVKMLDGIKLAQTEEGLAYDLIYRATLAALREVLEAQQEAFPAGEVTPQEYAEGLAEALKTVTITLSASFFQQPDQMDGVAEVQAALADWLKQVDMPEEAATTLVNAFKAAFGRSLITVWIAGRGKYEPLRGYFQHPFPEVWERQQYEARLAQLYHAPVWQHETMQLRHLYVEPHFYTYVECFEKEDERVIVFKQNYDEGNREPFLDSGYQSDLHSYLHEWVLDFDLIKIAYPNSQVLLLLGYPGQGKSSFCAKLLRDVLTKGWTNRPLFLIRLRDIADVKSLLQDPLKALVSHLNDKDPLFLGNTNQKTLQQSLLILDGLDELYMKDGLSKEDIQGFCEELGKQAQIDPRMRVVLTSRYGYINLQSLNRQRFVIHRLEGFTLKQQQTWLRNYKQFEKPKKFNLSSLKQIQDKDSPHHHLAELVNQPILLHMLATVDADLREATNKAALYEKLFDVLLKRKWATDGTLDAQTQLHPEQLKKYMAFIALKIYQSPFEYIRSRELEDYPESVRFMKRILGLEKKEVLSAVMMSFYMRQVEQEKKTHREEDENYAMEFLHKSLQEHLVAVHLWEVFKKLGKWDEDEGDYKVQSTEDILKEIYPILAPSGMSVEVWGHLQELIELADPEEREQLRVRMVETLPDLVERDFTLPTALGMGKLDSNPIKQILRVFKGYWAVLSHLGPWDQEGNLPIPNAVGKVKSRSTKS
ncbi:MAG: NACHT domain-containing protein, partial [Bacteroidota bacterium]